LRTRIEKKDIADILALTPMQEGMLYHHLKEPTRNIYVEQVSLNLFGEIDIKRFEEAWNFVIETNEMLRTVFRWKNVKNPIQIVLKEYNLKPTFYDFSTHRKMSPHIQLETVKTKERQRPFNLETIPFRISLCKLSNKSYEMIITNHHILYDGWSNGIILKEFFQSYNILIQRMQLERPEKVKYGEFVKWIRNQDLYKHKREAFWKKYLSGFDVKTELPVEETKEKRWDSLNIPAHYLFKSPAGMKDRLEAFAVKHKLTLASLFYSAWGILLQKYNNKEDVVFGTTVSGRTAKIKNIDRIVGLFINTLPLRLQTHAGETIVELLSQTAEMLIKREEFETTPLVEIKEYSEVDKKAELFDSVVVVENYPLDVNLLKRDSKLSVQSFSMSGLTNFNLLVNIIIFDAIEVCFKYPQYLFDDDILKKLAGYYIKILSLMVEKPEKKVSEIEIVSDEKKALILSKFNENLNSRFDDLPFQSKLFRSFEKHRDRIAIEWRNKAVTYSELGKRAAIIADNIAKKGINRQSFIGNITDDKVDFIAIILGVIKAGCVFVPLDSSYPQNRLEAMISSVGIQMIIGDKTNISRFVYSKKLKGSNIEYITLDESILESKNKKNRSHFYNSSPDLEYAYDDRIYVYFTSGSTGRPKATLGRNNSLLHFINWEIETLKIDCYFRISQFTPPCFDVFLRDLFVPLCSGGVVCLPGSKEILMDSGQLVNWINSMSINLIHCVPSLFRQFNSDRLKAEDFLALKYILLAGEKLNSIELINWYEIFDERIQLVNLCGPTETTLAKLCYFAKKLDINKKRIPIGKPIHGTRVIILDKNMNICDDGMTGEIYIRTPYRSFGYCNDPTLTNEKFIPNPFHADPNDIIYRTGDLGRISPDGNGNIEVMGRIDDQVKIRGFRVELGEIESQLLKNVYIKETVVISKETENEDRYLCAYYVINKGCRHRVTEAHRKNRESIDILELRDYLSRRLPDYMVPSYFVPIDRIPLTPNGKIDRKALPEPEIFVDKEYVAPRDEIEKKLVDIWSEVLSINKNFISIDSDFFELGGHSLKVTMLVSKIHKELDTEVSVSEVFKTPTIRELSGYIKSSRKDKFILIKSVEKKEYYELSSAQKRMYILEQMGLQCTAYNMVNVFSLEGAIDLEKLEYAYNVLIARHDSLRTYFELIDNKPVQRVLESTKLKIEYYHENSKEYKESRERVKEIINRFVRPFHLNEAPLLRVGLMKIESNIILMMDMHHIISDGISRSIFEEEFWDIYNDVELSELRLQYKDFSEWQNSMEQEEHIKRQEAYWINQFSDRLPILNLPFDFERPKLQSFEGDSVNFTLGKEDTDGIIALAKENEATFFMLMLSIFNILLSRITSNDDVIVATPVAGRGHSDLNRIVGMFVNFIPIRNYLEGDKTYKEFLKDVKFRILEAFENQEYPFEDLVHRISLKYRNTRDSLFNVFFVLQDINTIKEISASNEGTIKIENVTSKYFESKISRADLTMKCFNDGERLTILYEYCTKLFKRETIKKFINYSKKMIETVIKNPDIQIKEIDIISKEEKNKISESIISSKQKVFADFNV
jgi:amino acid adenylation domain-containing protein